YHVLLEEPFPRARIDKLTRGVTIEGERLKVEYASLINPSPDGSSASLDVHLHHGKKREIRQLFLALGHPVRRLKGYQIGALPLKGIAVRGVKRHAPKGIDALFELPGLTPRSTKKTKRT